MVAQCVDNVFTVSINKSLSRWCRCAKYNAFVCVCAETGEASHSNLRDNCSQVEHNHSSKPTVFQCAALSLCYLLG